MRILDTTIKVLMMAFLIIGIYALLQLSPPLTIIPYAVDIDYDEVGSVYGSGSMQPTLNHKQTLYYQTVKKDTDLNIGDIVAYETPTEPNSLILHRIIMMVNVTQDLVNQEIYVLKGDANTYADQQTIKKEQIKKKVVAITEGE